ncbi:MAG: type VI secretion system TssO [Janthinobacterium lividum]
MKPLNAPDIATAYFRFLGQFLVLMLSIIFIVYAFLKTFNEQTHLLHNYQDQYRDVLSTQRQMGQTVDSIYTDLSMLNTGQVGNERILELRVLHKKDELSEKLKTPYLNMHPHEAYRRITDCMEEMLVLKDSIHNVQERLRDVRGKLNECQNNERRKK